MKPLPNIGKPAIRALTNVGLKELDDLTLVNAKNLLKLHGLGPKAIALLDEALKSEGLAFGPEHDLPLEMDFLAIGDLACDNAPKRRVIRDFLLAAWMQDARLVANYLSPQATFTEAHQTQTIMELANILSAYHAPEKVSSLMLHQILSHGKEGAVHATIRLQTGRDIHIAEFYQFEGHRKDAQILKITRYVHASKTSESDDLR